MAPGAIFETPNVAENFNDHRDGLALEATSDAIDDVNAGTTGNAGGDA